MFRAQFPGPLDEYDRSQGAALTPGFSATPTVP